MRIYRFGIADYDNKIHESSERNNESAIIIVSKK